MAVSNLFNSLTFGGVNSADYGIYITGEAVYNAPKRAVDMVNVPGRNGAIAIDQGRWENIEIEYPAGTFGMTEAEFRMALSEFRNAIVSQIGYQRLTDTYHPDEYRLALYVEGLEVKPESYNRAGEFTLIFNAKPQRWLIEGETAVTVSDGDTLTNPTPYDAGPLLMVWGAGGVSVNGYDVHIDNEVYGNIELVEPQPMRLGVVVPGVVEGRTFKFDLNPYMYRTGDTITVNPFTVTFRVRDSSGVVNNIIDTLGSGPATVTFGGGNTDVKVNIAFGETIPIVFTAGTFRNYRQTSKIQYRNGASSYLKFTVDINIEYDNSENTLTFTSNFSDFTSTSTKLYPDGNMLNGVTVDSTEDIVGEPTYIDCEIGEAYKIEGGEYISLNKYIALGSDLPILKSGANEITLDNTITELKVKPNWWRL